MRGGSRYRRAKVTYSLQEATEHRADGTGGLRRRKSQTRGRIETQVAYVEYTCSLRQLFALVPTTDHILDGGVERRLCEAYIGVSDVQDLTESSKRTHEEPDRKHTAEVLRRRQDHGQGTPNEFHGRDLGLD